MDADRIIDEIEQLQEMFEAPDIRPLSASDISAANRRHDELLAHSGGFSYGSGRGFVAARSFPRSDSTELKARLRHIASFKRFLPYATSH